MDQMEIAVQFIPETVEILGGQGVFGRPVRSANDLDRAVSEGLPTVSASHTLNSIGFPAAAPAAISVERIVPLSTWKRRLKAGHLTPDEGDKVVRLAHLVAVARHVLGEGDIVSRFFLTPHPELGGRKPADAAFSEIGARQAEGILWRVFYGLPA